MMNREEFRKAERHHNRVRLGIAATAVGVAVLGIVVSAGLNLWAAKISHGTGLEIARMQLEASRPASQSAR